MESGMEYPICAEHVRPIELSHTDIDQQAVLLTGYNQCYEQLSEGRFLGKFLTCRYGDDFSIYIEDVNQKLFQRFAVPDDQYAICILMGAKDSTYVNGTPLSNNQSIIFAPGADVIVSTSATMKVCVISVAKSFFEENILFDAVSVAQSSDGFLSMCDRHPTASLQLIRSIGRSIDRLSTFDTSETDMFMSTAHDDKVSIVSAALALYTNPQTVQTVARGGKAAQRIDRFNSIISSIDAVLPELHSVEELCESFGYSRRTVETSFRQFLDASPYQYTKAVRLNRARRDLQSPQHIGLSIGDIASIHGIWHLGRFADEYRKMYGELPSETRRKMTPG